MRTVIKIIITTVLLSALLAPLGSAEARLKYYRYNDNIPMVEMSLNMMVAMGVLEPIPGRLVYDGNPYNRFATSRYGRYSDSSYYYPTRARYSSRHRYYDDFRGEPIRPYSRYSRSRYGYGYTPWEPYRDDYWDNRYYSQGDSPWDSPWGYPRSRRGYSAWDSPWSSGWGSPWDSAGYSPWGSAGYSPWSNPWYSSGMNPWASTLLNPWTSPYGYLGGLPLIQGYTPVPVLPESGAGDYYPGSRLNQADPQSWQNYERPGFKPHKTSWRQGARQNSRQYSHMNRPARARYRPLPARAEYARNEGSREFDTSFQQLNGLWIDDNGEMLGIRGDRFLWNDNNRYARGQLIKSPTMMEARIRETRTVVRFRYRLKGNEMVILSRDGRTRTFHRMPLVESQLASARQQNAQAGVRPDTTFLHLNYSYEPANAKSALSRPGNHERPGHGGGAGGVAGGAASYGPAWEPSRRVNAVRIAYPRNGATAGAPQASISTDLARTGALRPGETPDDGASAGAGSPLDESIAESAVPQPVSTDSREAQDEVRQGADSDAGDETASSLPAEADATDPYTYLFSYLKDPAPADGSDTPGAAAAASGDLNIWRPNQAYPQRRRDSIEAQQKQLADKEEEKFAWSRRSSWH